MFNLTVRINRRTYIVRLLTSILALFVAGIVTDYIGPNGSTLNQAVGILFFVFIILVVVYWLILVKQRANDISGKNAIIIFICAWALTPFMVILAVWPGENTANSYGKVPPKRFEF
jgi:uncharacterized membrane protein YhaH (DUF805 family)